MAILKLTEVPILCNYLTMKSVYSSELAVPIALSIQKSDQGDPIY
jgi:hypothetical protein